MPSPTDTELRIHDSPVPTQIVRGFDGSIAIAPIDWTGCLSKTGLNVVPPSCDFHTPPLAAPTKRVVLPPSFLAATAAMRPLIAAEPMFLAPSPERVAESNFGAPPPDPEEGAGGATRAGAEAAEAGTAITARPIGVPAGGKRKMESSASALTSARSMVIRALRGRPF